MAIAAIEGDNVATITKLIKKYQEQKDAHEEQLKQYVKNETIEELETDINDKFSAITVSYTHLDVYKRQLLLLILL